MEMQRVLSVEHDGHNYGLLAFATPTIHIVKVEGDDEENTQLSGVSDELVQSIKSEINNALSVWEVSIGQSDEHWLLDNELPDAAYDEANLVELNTDDGEYSAFILTELDTGNDQYWLLTPDTPPMFAVEFVNDDVRMMEDAEIDEIEPLLSNALDALLEEDNEDEGEE